MASKIEGKAKVITCNWNDINGQITPERNYSTAKNSCFTAIKNFDWKIREKKDLIRDFRYLEVLEGFLNCSTKNLNKEPSSLAFFYGAGSDRILGNDRGVGVSVFTGRKIKNNKKQNTPEWPWLKGQHRIKSARLKLGFPSVAEYGLSRNPKDQTGNNSHWV